MTQNINIKIKILQTLIKYKHLKFIYDTKHKHRNKKLKKCQKKNSTKFMSNLPEFEEKKKKSSDFYNTFQKVSQNIKRILKFFEL